MADKTKEVNLYAMLFLLVVLVLAGYSLGSTIAKLSSDDCVSISQTGTAGELLSSVKTCS